MWGVGEFWESCGRAVRELWESRGLYVGEPWEGCGRAAEEGMGAVGVQWTSRGMPWGELCVCVRGLLLVVVVAVVAMGSRGACAPLDLAGFVPQPPGPCQRRLCGRARS